MDGDVNEYNGDADAAPAPKTGDVEAQGDGHGAPYLQDEEALEKAKKNQKWKMEAAEFVGVGAFFLAMFIFIYFR